MFLSVLEDPYGMFSFKISHLEPLIVKLSKSESGSMLKTLFFSTSKPSEY